MSLCVGHGPCSLAKMVKDTLGSLPASTPHPIPYVPAMAIPVAHHSLPVSSAFTGLLSPDVHLPHLDPSPVPTPPPLTTREASHGVSACFDFSTSHMTLLRSAWTAVFPEAGEAPRRSGAGLSHGVGNAVGAVSIWL